MIVIKGGSNVQVKRFYFDAQLKMKCPNCGAEMKIDFSEDYLSYPEVGIEEEIRNILQ